MARLSNKEIKQQIAKLTGWETKTTAGSKSSEYERNYDIYRNKFRNYENTFGTPEPQPVNVQLLRTARKSYSYGLRQGLSVSAARQYVSDVIRGRAQMPELTTRERIIVTGSTVSTGRFTPNSEQRKAAINIIIRDFRPFIRVRPDLLREILGMYTRKETPFAIRKLIEDVATQNKARRLDIYKVNSGLYKRLKDVPSL